MMKKKERIMILGAGPFQVPAIRKAVDLGYEVITVDYLPDNVGHAYSHQYVNCSTTDREGVLSAARQLSIDGICTFSSDVAIPTVGYVCDRLGLPGVSFRSAGLMANKHLFRDFLREKRLPHPRYVTGEEFTDVEDALKGLRFPVVFKPVDTSGSRGLGLLETYEAINASKKFEYAKGFSRSGVVCVEEFIEGTEVGGDGILRDGRFIFIAITHKHKNNFVVTGHSVPTNISEKDQGRVQDALEECCAAIGYEQGPLNFDVIVTLQEVIILEMSARNGGNGIPSVIKRAFDVDVEEATLRMTVGEQDIQINDNCLCGKSSGSLVFGSEQSGILQEVATLESLRTRIPEVFDMFLAVKEGGRVDPFIHNGNMVGYVLFDCPESTGYEEMAELIRSSICLKIHPRRTPQ